MTPSTSLSRIGWRYGVVKASGVKNNLQAPGSGALQLLLAIKDHLLGVIAVELGQDPALV
jgi:hypothetical protein